MERYGSYVFSAREALDARYLVDPFIHQWRGYDDPANLQDNEHQMVFEDNMDSVCCN